MALDWTMYVTAHSVLAFADDAQHRRQAIAAMKNRGFSRVVLESYRGGCVVPENAIRKVRDTFETEGMKTLGGLMPVYGPPAAGAPTFGAPAQGIEARILGFCYSQEVTLADLEGEFRKLARLFGQVVIDDAFFTPCRCQACEQARAGRPWDVFRRELEGSAARRWYAAAHEERSEVVFTVKFPQYYDRYHLLGYDAEQFPKIFDAVWQGSETRDPESFDYGYVEPYEGYFNLAWMRACAGERFDCGWFDYLDCTPDMFLMQAVFSVLAAPKHMLVFCYHDKFLDSEKIVRLSEAMPALSKLHDAASTAVAGVQVVKPPNRDGGRDLFLFDFLGTMGIPCAPGVRMNPAARSTVITAHAADDSPTQTAIRDALHAGHSVAVTLNALLRMPPETQALFGYAPSTVAHGPSLVETFEIGDAVYRPSASCRIAGDLAPDGAEVLAWATVTGCEQGVFRIPFISVKTYSSGGRAVVWNIETLGHDAFPIAERLNVPEPNPFLGWPEPILNLLRESVMSPLGITFRAPMRVALFLFEKQAVVVNSNAHEVAVRIEGLTPDAREGAATIHVPARGYVQIPRSGA